MKTTLARHTGILASLLGGVLVLGGCASTDNAPLENSVQSEVQAAVDPFGSVQVSVAEGVATLSGFVSDAGAKDAAEAAATDMSGIEEVVNLITVEGDLDSFG